MNAARERRHSARIATVLLTAGKDEVDQRALELRGLRHVLSVSRRVSEYEVFDVGEKNGRDGGVVHVHVVLDHAREVDRLHVADYE